MGTSTTPASLASTLAALVEQAHAEAQAMTQAQQAEELERLRTETTARIAALAADHRLQEAPPHLRASALAALGNLAEQTAAAVHTGQIAGGFLQSTELESLARAATQTDIGDQQVVALCSTGYLTSVARALWPDWTDRMRRIEADKASASEQIEKRHRGILTALARVVLTSDEDREGWGRGEIRTNEIIRLTRARLLANLMPIGGEAGILMASERAARYQTVDRVSVAAYRRAREATEALERAAHDLGKEIGLEISITRTGYERVEWGDETGSGVIYTADFLARIGGPADGGVEVDIADLMLARAG